MPEHLALKLGRATEVPSRADSDEHRDVDQCFRDARSLPSHRGDDEAQGASQSESLSGPQYVVAEDLLRGEGSRTFRPSLCERDESVRESSPHRVTWLTAGH
jgi:hypothetical protein